jgi:hypothetical protein
MMNARHDRLCESRSEYLKNNNDAPPVAILVACLMHGLPWHPVLKVAFLIAASAVAAFALSAVLFRRIMILRQIL